jgi:hypothetical protein
MAPTKKTIADDFNRSLKQYEEVKKTIDRHFQDKGGQLALEVKNAAVSLQASKMIMRRLQNSLDSIIETDQQIAKEELDQIIKKIDLVFENIDDWENKWQSHIIVPKMNSNWYDPFDPIVADQIIQMRTQGHTIKQIAETFNIEDYELLYDSLNKWLLVE